MSHHYLIALGCNMRHPQLGDPRNVIAAALGAVVVLGPNVLAASHTVTSAPIGPSQRRYANGAAVIEAQLSPPALLALLQEVECEFGRPAQGARIGQRWRARQLDLDIILWSGGIWQSDRLTIPHREMASRDFVLGPAAQIAGGWRHPVSGLTLSQMHARLSKPAPKRKRAQ